MKFSLALGSQDQKASRTHDNGAGAIFSCLIVVLDSARCRGQGPRPLINAVNVSTPATPFPRPNDLPKTKNAAEGQQSSKSSIPPVAATH